MTLNESTKATQTGSSDHFHLKAGPIFLAILAAFGLSFLAFLAVEFLKLTIHPPERPHMLWVGDYYYNVGLFCFAYAAILLLKIQTRGAYGFHWPRGKSYLVVALGF